MTAALVAELNQLGLDCKRLGRYAEGRSHYERAMALLESLPDPDPEDIATLYHNLGGIEHARGDYAAAEPLARRGLAIRLGVRGAPAGRVAADMVALGAILDGLGRYEEAERLYLDALAEFERAPEDHAGDIAVALNDLGAQYVMRGRLEEAEALLLQAAKIKRRIHDPGHPSVAVTVGNLAVLSRRREVSAAIG